MQEDTQKRILRIVRDHDGEWGWYQIDRALSMQGILNVNVAAAMTSLRHRGLVTGEGDPQKASTCYSITSAGKAALGQ